MATYFVTAIDTDAGKTYATGYYAKQLLKQSGSTITLKIAQTGCSKFSDDIKTHREIMGVSLFYRDLDHTTCPYLFPFAASPHLSASLEGKTIDIQKIIDAIRLLESEFENVIIEGVGGLMVPLREDYWVIDLIEDLRIPVLLVTSAKIGSINHTLLSLEALKIRNITLKALLFNHFPAIDTEISESTKNYFFEHLKTNFPSATIEDVPLLK